MSPNPDHFRSPDPREQPRSTEQHSSPDRLHTRDAENLPTNWHRVAGSPGGTSRSSGSFLDEAAATLDFTPVVDYRDSEALKEVARQYRERAARSLALEEAAIEYNDAVHRADVIRRRIERRQATLQRRAERGEKKENRWANRPVKVEVDAAAWEAVKREAVRRRRTIGFIVGGLVSTSVQDGVLPRNRPQQMSVRRFTRLYVEDEAWSQFRVIALDAHVSIGRIVGMLVEREARLLKNGDGR